MKKELIVTAKTTEEATREGAEKLGVSAEDAHLASTVLVMSSSLVAAE